MSENVISISKPFKYDHPIVSKIKDHKSIPVAMYKAIDGLFNPLFPKRSVDVNVITNTDIALLIEYWTLALPEVIKSSAEGYLEGMLKNGSYIALPLDNAIHSFSELLLDYPVLVNGRVLDIINNGVE